MKRMCQWTLIALALTAEAGAMTITVDDATGRYTIEDNGRPVLTYNFATVPVPAGVKGQYAVARSDYVHPLYGPSGEVLTKDYSPDHPHHRGLYWAWPEVTWKGEKRDLHALQGVFARPVRMLQEAGAVLEAENIWKWSDQEPIVRERVTIRASEIKDNRRTIDFEFQFDALVPGVTIARRGQSAYGGFNLRFSARQQQTIVTNVGWAVIAGIPEGGQRPVSVAILQRQTNPEYPGDWIQYPNLNWLQPTFPTKGTAYELRPGAPLVLDYRLVVGAGVIDEREGAALWGAYNKETNK